MSIAAVVWTDSRRHQPRPSEFVLNRTRLGSGTTQPAESRGINKINAFSYFLSASPAAKKICQISAFPIVRSASLLLFFLFFFFFLFFLLFFRGWGRGVLVGFFVVVVAVFCTTPYRLTTYYSSGLLQQNYF